MLSLAAVSSVSSFCVSEENQNSMKMRYVCSIECIYSEASSKYNEANFFAIWATLLKRILRRSIHNLVNDDERFCTYTFSGEKQKNYYLSDMWILRYKRNMKIIRNIRNMKIIIGYSKLINFSVNQLAITIASKQLQRLDKFISVKTIKIKTIVLLCDMYIQ